MTGRRPSVGGQAEGDEVEDGLEMEELQLAGPLVTTDMVSVVEILVVVVQRLLLLW